MTEGENVNDGVMTGNNVIINCDSETVGQRVAPGGGVGSVGGVCVLAC